MIKYNISKTHFTVFLQAMGVTAFYGNIELDATLSNQTCYEKALVEMEDLGLLKIHSGCMVLEKTFSGIIRALVNSAIVIQLENSEDSSLYWTGQYWIASQRDPHRVDGFQLVPFKDTESLYNWLEESTQSNLFDEYFNFEIYSKTTEKWLNETIQVEKSVTNVVAFFKERSIIVGSNSD